MLYLEKLNSHIENKYIVSSWKTKRFVWRYYFFFTICYLVFILGITYTVTVRFLISLKYYKNHSCVTSNIKSIKGKYMTILVFAIIMAIVNFLFARLTHLYSEFNNSEFYSLGIYYTISGFLMKYTSWLLSIIYISWILFLGISIVYNISSPKSWCSLKFNRFGMDAVDNCFLVKSGYTGCEITREVLNIKRRENCNDFNMLKIHSFLFLTRSSPDLTCSLLDKKLCDFFVDFIKNNQISWSSFTNCFGNVTDIKENHFTEDFNFKSDFYLFFISLILFWFLTSVILFMFFVIIKKNTPIESSFIVNEERFNFFFKCTRLLDIWK